MRKIDFKPIPGTIGYYRSNMELVIVGSSDKIAKMLTIYNKGINWQIKHLKQKIDYWSKTYDNLVINNGSEDRKYKIQQKINNLTQQLEDIRPQQVMKLYTYEDWKLVVPPGMYYLCEKIEGNQHLNTQLPHIILSDCHNRPYQVEALEELYKYRRGIIELATGLGKSKLIQSVALAGTKIGKRTMIIVPTEYLVGQMYAEMKKLHPNTSAQGGGRWAEPGWDILVTTINSAISFSDLPHIIILDEAHHSPAQTWLKLLASAENAEYVYSFTATAFRSDGLDMAIHALAGPILYSKDAAWGIKNKWLSECKIFQIVITPKNPNGSAKFLSDYIPATKAYKILGNCPELMYVLKKKLLSSLEKGRKPIVIYKTVEACKKFRKFCEPDIDVNVASAQGGKKTKTPLYKFKTGEEKVLLANSGLVSEGLDFPDADTLFLATQNSSDITTMQMIGRILRISPNKKTAIVVDLAVKGYAQFERAAQKRLEAYKQIVGEENVSVIMV